ncbi:tyrosine-type recombinase/integrase [Brevibacillus brevis]|uniref:tyrosine-type recombinase/integrase n=1 Tax=Brevibacillus brevis TaxID=1393 RepID=UPI0037C6152A
MFSNVGASRSQIVQRSELKEIKELKETLINLSSKSDFDDDLWILDKAASNQSLTKGTKTLYYMSTPEQYVYLMKIYALLRLSENRKVRTIISNINGVNMFFTYLSEKMKGYPLDKVNKKIVKEYEGYLNKMNLKPRTKETYWTGVSSFFNVMSGFQGVPHIHFCRNPFTVPIRKRNVKTKYIEQTILMQLDLVFKNEDIPLVYRTAYWLCRLIPNRITEVCSMKIDCIKPYLAEKVISIPMFKQNGGHKAPEIRQIALKEEGMGKYLIDLIREQIEDSKSLQNDIQEEQKNFLLTYLPPIYIPHMEKYVKGKTITVLKESTFNRMIKVICKRYGVVDSSGKNVNLSSHMFRHNGITDRLYEGFRVIDIMSMTNHKSSQMITSSYVHVKNDELQKKAAKVLSEEKPMVMFRGRIINAEDPNKVKQILSRPFAHKIGRLGICSDISNCPSEMFECLACDFFVPNANEVNYFEEQVKQWEEKVQKYSNHPFLKENALYNLEVNKKIVKKILRGIASE